MKAVEFIAGVCATVAGLAGAYILIVGTGRLFYESTGAFIVAVGALAFAGYFYFSKADAKREARRENELTLTKAERIVQQYGAALAKGLPEGDIARPESYLPCSKETIKQAFKLVLANHIEYQALTKETGNLLIGAVSHLNAFVPDKQADRINANKLRIGDEECSQFIHDMWGSEIWAEMDEFVATVQDLDPEDSLFHQRVHTMIGLPYSLSTQKSFWDSFIELGQ